MQSSNKRYQGQTLTLPARVIPNCAFIQIVSESKLCGCREIVKRIDMWGIDMVFVVGGNGGNAGAAAIQAQCEKDGVVCNVVGVPKSIDNDILVVGGCCPVALHLAGGISQCSTHLGDMLL